MKKEDVKPSRSTISDSNGSDLDPIIERLRDLREERSLEFQVLFSREQWFWIPWTTCLAGALYSLNTQYAGIRIGIPVITLFIALLLAWRRKPGLEFTYRMLTERHTAVIELTRANPYLKNLGFDSRLTEIKTGEDEPKIIDYEHEIGLRYPLDIMSWTIGIWFFLIALGLLISFGPNWVR